MDGPIQNVFPHILNGWPHTECFTKHTKWMAKWMAIQNVSPYIINGWPHTECFSIRITWMAPYRMFFHTYYMDGPIQNYFPNVLNGWPHTE